MAPMPPFVVMMMTVFFTAAMLFMMAVVVPVGCMILPAAMAIMVGWLFVSFFFHRLIIL